MIVGWNSLSCQQERYKRSFQQGVFVAERLLPTSERFFARQLLLLFTLKTVFIEATKIKKKLAGNCLSLFKLKLIKTNFSL